MASQPLIASLVILNAEGVRICARYCNKRLFPEIEAERRFEREMLKKVSMSAGGHEEDVFEYDEHLVVYKAFNDVVIFVTSVVSESELLLADALRTFEEALAMQLGRVIEEENLLNNLEIILLSIDELLDQEGIIMETDSVQLVSRVSNLVGRGYFGEGIPLGEQTLTQALQTARDQLTRSILS